LLVKPTNVENISALTEAGADGFVEGEQVYREDLEKI
jgi:hypothetical protein